MGAEHVAMLVEAIADYRCCLLRSISAASFMRQAAGSNY